LAYARLAPLAWQWTVDGVQQEKRRAATVCGAARDFVAFGALFKAGHPDSTFVIPTLARYSRPMSTLAEIKQAAEVLPVEQKQRLVAFLLTGLRKDGAPLPPPRDIPKATIEQWVAEDEEGFRKFKAGA